MTTTDPQEYDYLFKLLLIGKDIKRTKKYKEIRESLLQQLIENTQYILNNYKIKGTIWEEV